MEDAYGQMRIYMVFREWQPSQQNKEKGKRGVPLEEEEDQFTLL